MIALEQRQRRRPLVARAAQRQRVLAADRRRARVLRLPERDRVRARRPHRRRRLDLPRRQRRQGQPHPRPAASSTSATTPGACRRSPSRAGTACGSATPKARCSAAAPSTRPPPSSTAASSSATPTGASTPTTPPPASSTGPCRPAPTCTPRPPSTNAPGLGPTVYIGSYNGSFYALNARSGHVSWRFNAHGRISGSATIVGRRRLLRRPRQPPHLRPRHLHRPRAVRKGHRRVRPRHQRRHRRLPHRRTPACTGSRPPAARSCAAPQQRAPRAQPPATTTHPRSTTAPTPNARRARSAPRHRRARRAQAHRRPPARRRRHATRAARHRPVAREAHAHHEAAPACARSSANESCPSDVSRPGPEDSGVAREHAKHAPVRAPEHFAQVRQPAADQARPPGRSTDPAARPAAPRRRPPARCSQRS